MITELTGNQKKYLIEFRQEWFDIGRSTEPANWDKAELAISEMYKISGGKPPKFIRCGSPLSANILISLFNSKFLSGFIRNTSLKNPLFNSLETSLRTSIGDSLGNSIKSDLEFLIKSYVGSSTEISVETHVGTPLFNSLFNSLKTSFVYSLRTSIETSIATSLGNFFDQNKVPITPTYFFGSQDAYWICFYLFCAEIGVGYEKNDVIILNLWKEVAESCSWFYTYENYCFVCDRPKTVLFSGGPGSTLHNPSGPSVEFRDGFKMSNLNGVLVPEDDFLPFDKYIGI